MTGKGASASILGVLLMAFLATGCGGPTVRLAAKREAFLSPNIAQVKVIAVPPLAGKTAQDKTWGEALSNKLNTWLLENFRRFPKAPRLVDRGYIEQVMEEQGITAAGIADKATAVKLGKLVQADAIVGGSVLSVISETIKSTRYGSSVSRKAVVMPDLKLLDVETIDILESTSVIQEQDFFGSVPETFRKAIEKVALQFGEKIVRSPTEIYKLKFAGWQGGEVKEGNTFADVHDYEAAAEKYEAAAEKDENNHVAWYNLGLVRLLHNKCQAAKECFDKALNIKVDKKYAKARSILKKELQAGGQVTFRRATREEIEDWESEREIEHYGE